MTTKTCLAHKEFATVLGINVRSLWSLSANVSCPAPIGGDERNVYWAVDDIETFKGLWLASIARGWRIRKVDLAAFDFVHGAEHSPGYVRRPSRLEVVRQYGARVSA